MEKIKVFISYTVSKEVEVEVPEGYDDVALYTAAQEKLPNIGDDWCVNDFVVIKD